MALYMDGDKIADEVVKDSTKIRTINAEVPMRIEGHVRLVRSNLEVDGATGLSIVSESRNAAQAVLNALKEGKDIQIFIHFADKEEPQ